MKLALRLHRFDTGDLLENSDRHAQKEETQVTERQPRPPFDPALEEYLASLRAQNPDPPTLETLPMMRTKHAEWRAGIDERAAQRGIGRRDVTVPGHEGDDIVLSVFASSESRPAGPGIYFIHGGGMIMGSRMDSVERMFEAIEAYGAVVVTVEYRLSPEFSDPYPVEDCYEGLLWTAANAADLGIDPHRLLIAGASAGGGLAAGTALLVRDRHGPTLVAQLLMSPMLDDRDLTVSARQIDGVGAWDRQSNLFGWDALLGHRRGSDAVSIYAAPGRATDLSGLPSTYIDCGSAEVFRDESVAFAMRLWEAGVQAELHVWAGGFHGFEAVEHAAVTKAAGAARSSWIDRVLGCAYPIDGD